jgi:hypothetical protein
VVCEEHRRVPIPAGARVGGWLRVGRQTWYGDLAIQGSINKFRALAFHGVRDRLSEPERTYLARRFPRPERIEVSWWREEFGLEGGRLVIHRTPLNAYSLTLR